jgi:hypothetical protein
MPVLAISRIPDDHPKRGAIEGAIHEALGAIPGDWSVRVSAAASAWTLSIRRAHDNFRRTLVLGENEQTPERIAMELEQALKDVA